MSIVKLFRAPDNASLCKVVRAHFDCHVVAFHDSDIVHSKLSGYVGCDFVAVCPLDILYKRADILHGAVRAMDGRVAYVIMGQKEIAEKDITYEDIHCISTILRDCDDIELGFTMYEEEENGWRCSFRSDGKWINVNELLKPFGGGGHVSAAGLKYQTDNVEELKKQILDRVAEMKNKQ